MKLGNQPIYVHVIFERSLKELFQKKRKHFLVYEENTYRSFFNLDNQILKALAPKDF